VISAPDFQNLIKSSPLFFGVPFDILQEKLANHSPLNLSAGEILIWPGDINDKLYFILSGRLSVQSQINDVEPIALLGEGECVGEMSILGDDHYSAYVLAATDCQVLALNQNTLWELIENSHDAAINMLKMMANRIRIGGESIENSFEQRYGFSGPSVIDEVTGHYKWSHTQKIFERLLYRGNKYDQSCGLIVLEIDGFKNYNALHGELGGDQAIRAIAQTILSCMRPHDLAGHLFGCRFAILLSNMKTIADGTIAAERLKEMIHQAIIVLPSGDKLPSVTASLGISQSQTDDSLLAFIEHAEQALGQAQAAGGNCVIQYVAK
jgi:diguanylate cyclase (GGDEF)-like protein